MKVFTKKELKKYDGSNGTAYIAFDSKVYDVSESYHWKKVFTRLCITPDAA